MDADATPARPTGHKITIAALMLLVAGTAVGVFVARSMKGLDSSSGVEGWLGAIIAVLGGLSLVGPPLLLRERRRTRARWGAGRFLWFTQGTATWLMWPPVIYTIAKGKKFDDSIAGSCYYWGTPLMAIYVTLALLAGGRLRRRRRGRRRPIPWTERFGLILGLAWACSGLYLLYVLYRSDFEK